MEDSIKSQSQAVYQQMAQIHLLAWIRFMA